MSEERIEQDFLAGEIAAWLRATSPEPRRGDAATGPYSKPGRSRKRKCYSRGVPRGSVDRL